MHASIDIAPPNSLILVMDPSIGEIPDSMSGKLITSTETCVAVGTFSEHDGSTRISIGDMRGSDQTNEPVFDAVLRTPGNRIAVCSILDEIILEISTESARTRVQIWANDHAEPSKIDIRVSRNDES